MCVLRGVQAVTPQLWKEVTSQPFLPACPLQTAQPLRRTSAPPLTPETASRSTSGPKPRPLLTEPAHRYASPDHVCALGKGEDRGGVRVTAPLQRERRDVTGCRESPRRYGNETENPPDPPRETDLRLFPSAGTTQL